MEAAEIITRIAAMWDVSPDDILQRTDSHVAAEARFVYMFYLKHEGRISLSAIGRKLGGFNHASVLHGIKQVNNRADIDRIFYQRLVKLKLDEWLTNHQPRFSIK